MKFLMEIDLVGAERLIKSRASPEPNSGCWLWTGYCTPNGYGRVCFKGEYSSTHVLSYKTFNGYIPKDADIHHKCEVRSCVNPDHLVAMDHRSHHRYHFLGKAVKSHCKHGHELTPDNVIVHYRSRNDTYERICRTCRDRRNNAR